LALGYGRTRAGKVGNGVGINAYPLSAVVQGYFSMDTGGVQIAKTGRHHDLACTQTHSSYEGRDIVREMTLAELARGKVVGTEFDEDASGEMLWKDLPPGQNKWGMAIDMSACTGCSACLVGCQSENNVAVVGREEVFRRREMHWIRLDRYFSGDEKNPDTVFQPMMCQHCGHAPCESVCPVAATVHSTDGLNQQVYNRCVGTRYCANNCPYKVRRFNWFDYANNPKFDYYMNDDVGKLVLNPDVVVRTRGVMEKCSMCVQRIQEGKLQAKLAGRALADGDIKLACEQSCPTDAIIFGDLADKESRTSKMIEKNPRRYRVLAELNVEPAMNYLAKVRNRPS
jgi:molybdopterin-containing oxidoreductase family iron-sulfur binding subunit